MQAFTENGRTHKRKCIDIPALFSNRLPAEVDGASSTARSHSACCCRPIASSSDLIANLVFQRQPRFFWKATRGHSILTKVGAHALVQAARIADCVAYACLS